MGSGRARWRLLPSEVIPRWTWKPRRASDCGVCSEKQMEGASWFCACWGCLEQPAAPPPSAVWWVYARVRHPKAVFGPGSSNMQRRTACPGPEPAAVLPARPPADQRGCLRHNITLRCQHEPNMAASITCAASKGHLCIIGTCANAESRQKCHLGSITWPRVLLAAQAALLVSWRAGREHRRWFWAKARNPARHIAAGGGKGRLRLPHSGVDPPDRRRWEAAGTSILPQQAQKKEAP
jgi:hypothetical protein